MSCFTKKKPKYFTAKRQSSLPFPLPYSDTENLFPHTAEHGCPVPAAPPERMLRCAAPQTRSVLQPTLRCPHALMGAGKRQRVKHTVSPTHTANRGYRQPYAHCVTGHMGHTGRTASPTAGTHPAPHPALRSPAQGSPRPAPLTGSPRAQLPAAGLGAAGLRRALGVGVGQPGGLGLPRPALVVARLDGVGPAAPAAHRGRRSQPPPRHHRVAPSPRRGTAPGSVRTRPRSRHGPLSLLVSHSLTLSAPSPPGVLSPLLPPLSTPSAGLPPSLRCPLPSLKSPSQSPSPLPPPFPPPPPASPLHLAVSPCSFLGRPVLTERARCSGPLGPFLQIALCTRFTYITEPQNHSSWEEPLGITQPNPSLQLLPAAIAQENVQVGFEYL